MLNIQKKLTNIFYAILSLPATAMGFALSIQIAVLSWILNTKYGLDIHEVGIVWAAGPLAGIFGQVIVGFISDKVWFWGGRRRPFILIGGTLAALMILALPGIDIINESLGIGSLLAVAIVVALTLDMAINISFNPTRSIIADVTPEGVPRTKGYTWMQTISGTFGVLAYAIGAIFGNYFLIYFGAGLVLIFSVVPMFFIEESKELNVATTDDASDASAKFSMKETLIVLEPLWGFILLALYFLLLNLFDLNIDENINNYIWIGLLLVQLFLTVKVVLKKENDDSTAEMKTIGFKKVLAAHSYSWVGVQTMFVYIIAYIQQKLSPESNDETGQIIAISFLILNAVGAILPAFVLEPITEKIGRVKTHLSCVAIMAIGYFAIVAVGKTAFLLYIIMAIVGVGWAAIVSLPFAIMSEKVDKNRMGFFMGIFNLSVVLPQLFVSLVLGLVILQAADKNLIFIISGISLAISAILWIFVKDRNDTGIPESQVSN